MPSQDELIIENFKSGLVCPEPSLQADNSKKHSPKICFENDTIFITGQSKCVFNDEHHPCTWHGFEFDYNNAKPDQKLDCITRSDAPGTFGNPNEVEIDNTKIHKYELMLDHTKSHFFNPTYSTFGYRPVNKNIVKFKTECFADSKRVFKYSKELIYPEKEKTP